MTGRALLGLLLVAAPLVAASTPAVAQDAPVADPLAVRIRAATTRAAKALATATRSSSNPRGTETLVALALLRAGGPEERLCATRILEAWCRDQQPVGETTAETYDVSLGISALEALELDPVIEDPPTSTLTRFSLVPIADSTRELIRGATRGLLLGVCTGVADDTRAWGYGCSSVGSGLALPADRPFVPKAWSWAWDNSCTQFATLALHDAARAKVAIPQEVVSGLVAHFLTGCTDSSAAHRWGYNASRPDGTPAMTFGALSSLAILRELGANDPRVDGAIKRGLTNLGGLIDLLGETSGGSAGLGTAYGLFSLEKALDLLEVEPAPGKSWFPPLAERVLSRQGADGLWSDDLTDSALYVLFLVRATIATSRLQGHTVSRPDPAAAPDALAKLKAFAEATGADVAPTRAAADLALRSVFLDGKGREVSLLAALGELSASHEPRKREAAGAWLLEAFGHAPGKDELKAAARVLGDLLPGHAPAALVQALAPGGLLPARTYAARHLARNPTFSLASAVLESADSLWRESALETPAGARCARALAAALAPVVSATLPRLPANVDPPSLRWLVKTAREALETETAACIDGALAAHAVRDANTQGWASARTAVLGRGRLALARLVALADADGPQRARACALLRDLTGEKIGDDSRAWRDWLASRPRLARTRSRARGPRVKCPAL